MTPVIKAAILIVLTASCSNLLCAEPGFTPLTDGRSFDGWRISSENPDTWSIQDGAFVAKGPRSHLFYVGQDRPFKNFHLKVDVMTRPGSNGGIYFHTDYQDEGWPESGFECQVNVTHRDWRKTGSLWGVVNIGTVPLKDNQWWTQEIIVEGNSVTVILDGKLMFTYEQPVNAQAGERFERVLSEGTFALQGHDPDSEIHYKNIRVKRLAD